MAISLKQILRDLNHVNSFDVRRGNDLLPALDFGARAAPELVGRRRLWFVAKFPESLDNSRIREDVPQLNTEPVQYRPRQVRQRDAPLPSGDKLSRKAAFRDRRQVDEPRPACHRHGAEDRQRCVDPLYGLVGWLAYRL